jgi:hypothetical protein
MFSMSWNSFKWRGMSARQDHPNCHSLAFRDDQGHGDTVVLEGGMNLLQQFDER